MLDDLELGELTDDAIAGSWRVWQRRRGHRYSLDDLATAHMACRLVPDALAYADLGCGLGSVLLMVAYKLPAEARLAGVEAQAVSFELARRNVRRNGDLLADRTRLVLGDLRDPGARRDLGGPFGLITGTPPYFPAREATPSTDPQRAAARLELRGGVEAYLEAAGDLLAPGGTFVMCASAVAEGRGGAHAPMAGLRAARRRDVYPRVGRSRPLFTVWAFRRARGGGERPAPDPELTVEHPLHARDADGRRTEEHHDLRRFFDLAVNLGEPPSPGPRP
ncbi:MAG: tRNA1(Val) (adenine(37)-N6)-methyltransferase [Sandaracinaceae bacterium]